MRKIAKLFALIGSFAVCTVCAVVELNPVKASAATPAIQTHGASVRTVDPTGLRFLSSVSAEYAEGYKIGTLIVPKAVLGENTLNHNDDTADEVDVDYVNIERTQWSNKAVAELEDFDYDETRYYFNAVLTGIPNTDFGTVLVARTYAVKDGVYIYGETVERSIASVAATALQSGETSSLLEEYIDVALGENTPAMVSNMYVAQGETALNVSETNGYAVTWTSSNESVATVDKNGVLTAKANGKTTITGKLGTNSFTSNIQVGELPEGEKIVDFTAEDATKQVKGGNATVGYNNDVLFNGDGLMTATNSINWQGEATVSMDLSYYSKINFLVYQNNSGGRFVKVLAKDSTGSYNVVLFNKTINKGDWSNVEIDVNALTNKSTDLRFVFGTGGENGSIGDTFYFTDFYGERLDKVVDFTGANYSQEAKGGNASVSYSNDVLFNGDGTLTLTNTINWVGSATLNSVDVSYYSKISFSVYQSTGGGRTVKVSKKDASGTNVQLVSKVTQSGVWTKFELNVSDLENNSGLIIYIGTSGDNGSQGNMFYVSDIYGERLDKVVDFTAENYSQEAKGGNASVSYSNDVLFNDEGTLAVTNTINWEGSATLLNPVDVAAYSKIIFSVCQTTGGGRTVRVYKKDATGANVLLVSKVTQSGVWTKFELNVSELANNSTELLIFIGTGGNDGQQGNTFYFSDIYGVK